MTRSVIVLERETSEYEMSVVVDPDKAPGAIGCVIWVSRPVHAVCQVMPDAEIEVGRCAIQPSTPLHLCASVSVSLCLT